MIEELASYRHCVQKIRDAWPDFLIRRSDWLRQRVPNGANAEKVTENILGDLFSRVLDWPIAGIAYQVGRADIELTANGIKRIVLETKRPGAIVWTKAGVEKVMNQARGYADEQHVKTIVISEGAFLYAADIVHGGLRDRVFASLFGPEPPLDLWWLSVHGIYRERPDCDGIVPTVPPLSVATLNNACNGGSELLHPKYAIPVNCFAYVGNASKTSTWRLPYKKADGKIDEKRLPKAIQAILTNYRGAQVSGIPVDAIPSVLRRLRDAAEALGRLPPQTEKPAKVYQELLDTLEQLA